MQPTGRLVIQSFHDFINENSPLWPGSQLLLQPLFLFPLLLATTAIAAYFAASHRAIQQGLSLMKDTLTPLNTSDQSKKRRMG